MINQPLNHEQIKALPLGYSVTGELPGRRERRRTISAQNAVRQVTKPGLKSEINPVTNNLDAISVPAKVIFHPKKFHAMQYQNYAEIWKKLNTSKRIKP